MCLEGGKEMILILSSWELYFVGILYMIFFLIENLGGVREFGLRIY